MIEHYAQQVVFVGSTGGGVLSRLARHDFVRALAREAVSDRHCGFLEVAARHGIAATRLERADGLAFSDALCERYENQPVLFFSFYTRLFRGALLEKFAGRIFNCHPSLLPSFRGMNGFEDTLASSSTFMGSTIHVVDEGMDTGPCLLQAALPLDRDLPLAENRHKIFLSQYYSALQLLRWIGEGRLAMNGTGRWTLEGGRYAPSVFSPNLDEDFFHFIGEEDALALASRKTE